jgi:hypothetical protein
VELQAGRDVHGKVVIDLYAPAPRFASAGTCMGAHTSIPTSLHTDPLRAPSARTVVASRSLQPRNGLPLRFSRRTTGAELERLRGRWL